MTNVQAWAADVAQRAVSTAAQAALGLMTTNTAGWTHLSFAAVSQTAGVAALICVLQHLSELKGNTPAGPVVGTTVITGTVESGPVAPDPTPVSPRTG